MLSKSLIDKLHYFSFGLVIFTIPFPMLLNNIAIFIFIFFSLLNIRRVTLNQNFINYFFFILFLLSVFSLTYTCNLESGLKMIEKTLSFIIFFLFVPTLNISNEQINKILNLFVYGCLIVLFFFLATASYNFWSTGSLYIFNPENLVNENYFFYHRFTKPFDIHAVYFGMYLVFSSCILLYNFKDQRKKIKIIRGLILILFAVGIYLLQSFAVLSVYFIVLLFFLTTLSRRKINFKKLGVLLIIILMPATIFYQKAKVFDGEVFNYSIEEDVHSRNWNSLNIRLAKWECALEVFKENNILIGSGVGCTQDKLDEMYQKKNFTIGINKRFNTHNQYLHYLVTLGILGVLAYLIFLIAGLYKSLTTNDFLLFAIIAMITICSVTENIFGLNKGIVFFTSIYYLILLRYEKE
ncbi:O-antigen ligase family protein [Ulvibacter litoralis]|uniref:O-antigen ligase n=2 Tax=Ulvibacter litoralis TaxID=227084 RepID=A0A1G7D8Q6_9FLAO|nr:O-antigen ligase [Ulvibacter litoralis]